MVNGKRSMGLFGVSGVLVAVLIIAAFVAMGGIFQAQANGTLTIEVTDAPTEIDQLWLTIDEIKIQGDSGWVPLTLVEEATHFDLLTLQDVSAKLADGVKIPVGDYSMIQMHVKDASTTETGEPNLTVPSNVIKVLLQPKLSIGEQEDATVLIDLQPDDVHAIENSHTINIRPVVKSVIENGVE
jgi:Domain of unknown function (DUF4382)